MGGDVFLQKKKSPAGIYRQAKAIGSYASCVEALCILIG
jgi:hypothetical protein